jgi:hypothetical protein
LKLVFLLHLGEREGLSKAFKLFTLSITYSNVFSLCIFNGIHSLHSLLSPSRALTISLTSISIYLSISLYSPSLTLSSTLFHFILYLNSLPLISFYISAIGLSHFSAFISLSISQAFLFLLFVYLLAFLSL